MVPPVAGNEDRIAGIERRDARGGERIAKPRETVEIGVLRIDERQRRRIIERPDIEVRDLIGREREEAPPSRDHAGEIMVAVVVRLGLYRAAEPQLGPDIGGQQRHRVLADEIGQRAGERQHLDRERRDIFASDQSFDPRQRIPQRRLPLGKGEFAQVGAIGEAAARPRGRLHHRHGHPAVHARQIGVEAAGRMAPGRQRDPVVEQPLDDDRRFGRDERGEVGGRGRPARRDARQAVERGMRRRAAIEARGFSHARAAGGARDRHRASAGAAPLRARVGRRL